MADTDLSLSLFITAAANHGDAPVDPDAIDPDVFEDAADLIERDGWWNGEGSGVVRSYCAGMAIGAAAAQRSDTEDFAHAHLRAFARHVGVRFVPTFNDEQDSPQPVLDALRKCAKEYRS